MINSILYFDQLTERFFDLHRTPLLTEFFLVFTYLGDARVIIVLAISMAVVLLRHHRFAYVGGFAASIGGSFIFAYLLKLLIARDRPLPSLAAIDAPGYSFPSLHAACAMATYAFLAFMIGKLLHPPHFRVPAITALSVLIVLIGFSRLYLGVHYPSDVLAGYFIGGFFAWFGVRTSARLESRTKNSVWRIGSRKLRRSK